MHVETPEKITCGTSWSCIDVYATCSLLL